MVSLCGVVLKPFYDIGNTARIIQLDLYQFLVVIPCGTLRHDGTILDQVKRRETTDYA